MKNLLYLLAFLGLFSCSSQIQYEETDLKLSYEQPAKTWNEALPIGNGRLGAMVFGTVTREQIQFNEETLWNGEPHSYAHQGAYQHLDEIRNLLFEGKQKEAQDLASVEFMSVPLRQKKYQPFGDLIIEFPGHEDYTDYTRLLDIENAVARTTYKVGDITYTREILASEPDQVIAVHLTADQKDALGFHILMNSPHQLSEVKTDGNQQSLYVDVIDGVLKGIARIEVKTKGTLITHDSHIEVKDASSATIYLSASTNHISYKDVSADPEIELAENMAKVKDVKYKDLRSEHIEDYHKLFKRFSLDFGINGRETLPTDKRLHKFNEDPIDPQLIALYVQYGRYLMISSSRPGTFPATLQGIWNQDMDPAWDSKYTTNINAEMNYWPAEMTNLADCHDALFNMIEEVAQTGKEVAREHYNCDGWVLHHNTDIWRGSAPINASNHGIWLGGSGWMCSHLWEHYLFTKDTDFLRDRAWPLMKGAATFYSQFLIEDPVTGWLISTPSNSPENGGLVAGPTMDHQIIRSLFNACIETTDILGLDKEFADLLRELTPKIAPNQIGQHGQLQEWMEDKDNPNNHHRHVSHLWGVTPGADITWETSPDVMKAAIQSLIFRGDEGTGWSLAWKINFWARFMDGNHAYELIKLLFRVKEDGNTQYRGGGSYINLFDSHPPFQIDGNFGAPAGMVEMLIQSHQSAIDILPALPDALPNGSISGVCARGGFELSFSWANGVPGEVKVLSKSGETLRVRYKGETKELETEKGKTYKINF